PGSIVESGRGIDEAFPCHSKHFATGVREYPHLVEQCLAVERLAIELPGAGLVGSHPLRSTRGTGGGDDHRNRGTEAGIGANLRADRQTTDVGELVVEDEYLRHPPGSDR